MTDPGVDGVVFAPHYYPLVKPPPGDVACDLAKWSTIGTSWNRPVFVGEFGTSHDSTTATDDMTGGALFYVHPAQAFHDWFKKEILERPADHPRVAHVGPVWFYK